MGLLQDAVPGIQGDEVGITSVPQHIQCGSGRSVLTLGSDDGTESSQALRVRKGGSTPKRPLLRG